MTDPISVASRSSARAGPSPASHLRAWILASRPKTLVAALAPVVLACAAAWRVDAFQILPASLCLAFAGLIQIATNWANDYYDFCRGADSPARTGPTRAVAAGLITPTAMHRAMVIILILAFVVGCGLLPYLGLPGLVLGLVCILCAVGYTGGPFPLAYHGWGDVFVFIFFGLVAVNVTFMVQAGYFQADVVILALVPGALATNLLVVNHDRDRDNDARAGKQTLVVRFGRRFGHRQYGLLLLIALGVPVTLWARGWNAWVLLPWLSAPLALMLYNRLVRARDAEAFQWVLTGTARLLGQYSALLALGVLLG